MPAWQPGSRDTHPFVGPPGAAGWAKRGPKKHPSGWRVAQPNWVRARPGSMRPGSYSRDAALGAAPSPSRGVSYTGQLCQTLPAFRDLGSRHSIRSRRPQTCQVAGGADRRATRRAARCGRPQGQTKRESSQQQQGGEAQREQRTAQRERGSQPSRGLDGAVVNSSGSGTPLIGGAKAYYSVGSPECRSARARRANAAERIRGESRAL